MDTSVTCTVPFRFGRRIGDAWACPHCGRKWVVDSNMHDSHLPFGDYTWWTEIERPGLAGKLFGPRRVRATRFQEEPPAADRARMQTLLHLFASLGLPREIVFALYDHNPAAELAYHGAAHGVATAARAIDFATASALGEENIRPLAVAALFHDAGYVPGDSEDDNLARAVAFTLTHGAEYGQAAAALIPETRFPHTDPGSIVGAVLQDADLLQCFDTDRDRWIRAYKTETGKPALLDFPTLDMLHTSRARQYRARAH